MLMIIAIVLIVLWFLGVVTSETPWTDMLTSLFLSSDRSAIVFIFYHISSKSEMEVFSCQYTSYIALS